MSHGWIDWRGFWHVQPMPRLILVSLGMGVMLHMQY